MTVRIFLFIRIDVPIVSYFGSVASFVLQQLAIGNWRVIRFVWVVLHSGMLSRMLGRLESRVGINISYHRVFH